MKTAIYPGSFDPVTFGHIDIIKRTAKIFDSLIVGVLNNNDKTPLFSVEERVNMLKDVTKELENVTIISYEGLLVDYCEKNNINVIIRGLRAAIDFDFELQLAQTNRKLVSSVDTMFLSTSLEYAYLSSSAVKDVACYGGDISQFVPVFIADMVYERYKINRK